MRWGAGEQCGRWPAGRECRSSGLGSGATGGGWLAQAGGGRDAVVAAATMITSHIVESCETGTPYRFLSRAMNIS